MTVSLFDDLHNYYEGYLKAVLKGGSKYSYLLRGSDVNDAKKLAAITGADYRITEFGIELEVIITKKQIENIDNKLFIVTPYILSICSDSAYDRMNTCIDVGEPLPEWAYVILNDIVRSEGNTKRSKMILTGLDQLRKRGLIRDPCDKLPRIIGTL